MLVKGGYIQPEELEKAGSLLNEQFSDRMNRAASVFYDYVVNYSPELLSPQHNSFYEAAMKSVSK